MALIVYGDVILPNSLISAGIRGRNTRMNERVQNQGGFDTVNVVRQHTLRQFELGTVPLSIEQWQALEGLYEVTDAGAYGFLMEDPKDCSAAAAPLYPIVSGELGGTIGFGYGVPTYKMFKRYTSAGSARTKDRQITRPKSASVISRGGITVTHGAGAGNVSIDYSTGTVTFFADTSQAITGITVGASTVVTFSGGSGIVPTLGIGDRVYLNNISGTAATALNGKSHQISAKGANSFTISTSTTGLAATGGTAYKYPQASEALAWTGRFYVPVHFADDEIDWELRAAGQYEHRLLEGPSVVLVEVRE